MIRVLVTRFFQCRKALMPPMPGLQAGQEHIRISPLSSADKADHAADHAG